MAGAKHAGYLLVRLPHEVRPLFVEWLEQSYPSRAAKVLSQLRSMRGGRLNDPRFVERHTGEGPYAQLLARRFELACERLALNTERFELHTSRFDAPRPRGRQGSLFG